MKHNTSQTLRFGRRASGAAPLSLAAAMFLCTPAAKADLIGATVTTGGYCCTAPVPADLFTNTPTGTVPVSFPVGSLMTIRHSP